MDELAGAVDRVDDPHGRVALERAVHRRVRVDGLLADDHGAGEQGGEGLGEPDLGEAVGRGDQVVRAGLLVDVVVGELPEARHDLGGRRLPDGLGDVVEVAVEESPQFGEMFDHVSIRPCRADSAAPPGEPAANPR